jgi:hypothetical protein
MTTKKHSLLIIFILLQAFISASCQKSNDSFSIIILPDTQNYTSKYPDIFHQQMDWIVKNKNLLNIQYVIHMGDITDKNQEYEWEVASSSYKTLENAGIPYCIVCGDNDIRNPDKNNDNYDGIRHTELLNRYFPVSRLDKPGSWWRGGFFDSGKIDNYYCLFNYKDSKFMIMNLEIAPRSAVLNWADSIISSNASRKAIVVTHDYIDRNGKRLDDLKSFGMDGRDITGKLRGNNADGVFKKLIKNNSNIFMVLCGHKAGAFQKTIKIKKSQDSEEKRKVFEILTDYQDERLNGSGKKSGDGLLRILKFHPEKKGIVLSTVNSITGSKEGGKIHLLMGK